VAPGAKYPDAEPRFLGIVQRVTIQIDVTFGVSNQLNLRCCRTNAGNGCRCSQGSYSYQFTFLEGFPDGSSDSQPAEAFTELNKVALERCGEKWNDCCGWSYSHSVTKEATGQRVAGSGVRHLDGSLEIHCPDGRELTENGTNILTQHVPKPGAPGRSRPIDKTLAFPNPPITDVKHLHKWIEMSHVKCGTMVSHIGLYGYL